VLCAFSGNKSRHKSARYDLMGPQTVDGNEKSISVFIENLLASRAIFIHSLDNVKRLPMVIYYFGVVIL
jgi:hypothetical protein